MVKIRTFTIKVDILQNLLFPVHKNPVESLLFQSKSLLSPVTIYLFQVKSLFLQTVIVGRRFDILFLGKTEKTDTIGRIQEMIYHRVKSNFSSGKIQQSSIL